MKATFRKSTNYLSSITRSQSSTMGEKLIVATANWGLNLSLNAERYRPANSTMQQENCMVTEWSEPSP